MRPGNALLDPGGLSVGRPFGTLILGALLLNALFLSGCADDCEKAADTTAAKFEECGIDEDAETADEECTEAYGTASLCKAACAEEASCSALTGDDNTAQLTYASCIQDCG